MLRGQVLVHRIHYVLVRMRTRDLEYARVPCEDAFGSSAKAARDDDAAVMLQSLADRIQ